MTNQDSARFVCSQCTISLQKTHGEARNHQNIPSTLLVEPSKDLLSMYGIERTRGQSVPQRRYSGITCSLGTLDNALDIDLTAYCRLIRPFTRISATGQVIAPEIALNVLMRDQYNKVLL
jgi:hypothetical protein